MSHKKHNNQFQLSYVISGTKGTRALVSANFYANSTRLVIDQSSFNYIVVEPTNFYELTLGVPLRGISDIFYTFFPKLLKEKKDSQIEKKIIVVVG